MADKQFKDWTNTDQFARRDRLPINKFSDDKDYHINVEDLIRALPAWDSGITYADGEFVTYADKIYYSIQNNNVGNEPATEPTQWIPFGYKLPAYDGGLTYSAGDFITYSNKIYYSLQNSNSGRTPSSQPTWWAEYGGGGGIKVPVWSSSITYSLGDVISYNGVLYNSLQNSNTNRDPDSEITWWKSKSVIGEWDSSLYYADGEFIAYNDKLYYSKQDYNINKTPSSQPTWWAEYGGSGYTITENDESGNFTVPDITASEYFLTFSGLSADATATFPTLADNLGKFLLVKNLDATYKVTMDGEGAETLDGSLTKLLTGQNEWAKYYATSGGWIMVAGEFTVNGTLYVEHRKGDGHQTLPNGALTTITDMSYTFPENGIYEIIFMGTFFSSADDRLCYVTLDVNSAIEVEAISHITFNTLDTYTHAVGSYIASVSRGQTLGMRAFSLGGGNNRLVGSSSYKGTGWSIKKIANQ